MSCASQTTTSANQRRRSPSSRVADGNCNMVDHCSMYDRDINDDIWSNDAHEFCTIRGWCYDRTTGHGARACSWLNGAADSPLTCRVSTGVGDSAGHDAQGVHGAHQPARSEERGAASAG